MIFWFTRWPASITIQDITYIDSTPENCQWDHDTDQCWYGLKHAINECQVNSHEVTGTVQWLTPCGMYEFWVQNCSGQYLLEECDWWHEKWPSVGLAEGAVETETTVTATISGTAGWTTLTISETVTVP
jgi:hypothetical protein